MLVILLLLALQLTAGAPGDTGTEAQWGEVVAKTGATDNDNDCDGGTPVTNTAAVTVANGTGSATAITGGVATHATGFTFAFCSKACLKIADCMFFTLLATAPTAKTCTFYKKCGTKKNTPDATGPTTTTKLYTRPCVKPASNNNAIADSFPNFTANKLSSVKTLAATPATADVVKFGDEVTATCTPYAASSNGFYNNKGEASFKLKCGADGKLAPSDDAVTSLKCEDTCDAALLKVKDYSTNGTRKVKGTNAGTATTGTLKCDDDLYAAADGTKTIEGAKCLLTGKWDKVCKPIFDTLPGKFRKVAENKKCPTETSGLTCTDGNANLAACAQSCDDKTDCKFFAFKKTSAATTCTCFKECTTEGDTGSTVYHKEQCIASAKAEPGKYYQLKYHVLADTVTYQGNFLSVAEIPTGYGTKSIVKKTGDGVNPKDPLQVFQIKKTTDANQNNLFNFHTANKGAVISMNAGGSYTPALFARSHTLWSYSADNKYIVTKQSKSMDFSVGAAPKYEFKTNWNGSANEIFESDVLSGVDATADTKKSISMCFVQVDDQDAFAKCKQKDLPGKEAGKKVLDTANAALGAYDLGESTNDDTKYAVGKSIRLNCKAGHYGPGVNFTCTKSGTEGQWSPNELDLEGKCTAHEKAEEICKMEELTLTKVLSFKEKEKCSTDKAASVTVGQKCTVVCPNNFYAKAGTPESFTCKAGATSAPKGKWEAEGKGTVAKTVKEAKCVRKDCSAKVFTDRNMVLKENDADDDECVNKKEVKLGKACKLACKPDSYSDTSTPTDGAAKCTEDNGWEIIKQKTCYKKCDPKIGAPAGVKFVNSESNAFNGLITHSATIKAQCADGYKEVGTGDALYKCNHEGDIKLISGAIKCESKKCEDADFTEKLKGKNATGEAPGDKDDGETVTLTCKQGFTGTATFKCNRAEGWVLDSSCVAGGSEAKWEKCADEDYKGDKADEGVCTCTGKARFGVDGDWEEKDSEGSIKCSIKGFGKDPAPKKTKICQCQEREWKKCADEGEEKVCQCTGKARFGFGTKWEKKDSEGTINCNKEGFGNKDPFKNQKKICECQERANSGASLVSAIAAVVAGAAFIF